MHGDPVSFYYADEEWLSCPTVGSFSCTLEKRPGSKGLITVHRKEKTRVNPLKYDEFFTIYGFRGIGFPIGNKEKVYIKLGNFKENWWVSRDGTDVHQRSCPGDRYNLDPEDSKEMPNFKKKSGLDFEKDCDDELFQITIDPKVREFTHDFN